MFDVSIQPVHGRQAKWLVTTYMKNRKNYGQHPFISCCIQVFGIMDDYGYFVATSEVY